MRFDEIYMFDWSSASKPTLGKDSIWLAAQRVGDAGLMDAPVNYATRAQAWDRLRAIIERCEQTGIHALVGFDFAFAYPAGTAKALGLGVSDSDAKQADMPWAYTWRCIAAEIDDNAKNQNNRFQAGARLNRRIQANLGTVAGPFWGFVGKPENCPPGLTAKKPRADVGLAQWRAVEQYTKGAQPGWKLAYVGSVGGQALVGIAGLQKLREHGYAFNVWPFEPHDTASSAKVTVAEIYPSLWPLRETAFSVKDANQVADVARRMSGTSSGSGSTLTAWINRADLPASAKTEEGWVLGCVDGQHAKHGASQN